MCSVPAHQPMSSLVGWTEKEISRDLDPNVFFDLKIVTRKQVSQNTENVDDLRCVISSVIKIVNFIFWSILFLIAIYILEKILRT